MSQPPSHYGHLLKTIRQEIASAKELIERRTVVMYWNIGRAMAAHLGPEPEWGSVAPLARRLSADLSVNPRTLEQALQFHQAYPRLDTDLPLSWSHYRCLAAIGSPAERLRWEKTIIKENLNAAEFLLRLKDAGRSGGSKEIYVLDAHRGEFYHYRVIKSAEGEAGGQMVIDLGFDIHIIPPPHEGELVNKYIVRSDWTGQGYRVVLTRATAAALYTYRAALERVIDGDTLLVSIDCGFDVWTRQRLRLKGIDASELTTIAGRRAKDFVQKALASDREIIIRTSKDDKYGRYLADVWTGETCLNQALLNKGLAEIYEKIETY